MTHEVFISYSTKDKPIADGICANLEAKGVRCWIAPRDIAPGEDWPTAITRAISVSRIMVLVFSSNSNSSEDVGRELILAANSKLVIIPFKIENIEPEPGKQYYLARTHWLDAINPPTQEQIDALIDCVKAILPVRGSAPFETLPADRPFTHNETSTTPRLRPAPGKKRLWVRYLWIPVLLLMLGLIGGWMVLTFVLHPSSGPFATQITATATQPTPEPPIVLPTPSSPTLAPLNWNVNISDPFSSNVNRWPKLYNENDGCSVSSLNIENGSMLWTLDALDQNFCGYVYYPGISPVSDFDTTMDIQRSSGAGEADFGIGFRIINSDNYYIFVINDISQSFEVRRILNNTWLTLEDWKYASAINPVGNNHLAVSARGPVFNFYINDSLVDTLEDPGILHGFIGVISEIYNGGNVSISYDNFLVHGMK